MPWGAARGRESRSHTMRPVAGGGVRAAHLAHSARAGLGVFVGLLWQSQGMTAADPAGARAACLHLIASFKAAESSAERWRRRPVILDPRQFFIAAMPLFEYLMVSDEGEGSAALPRT